MINNNNNSQTDKQSGKQQTFSKEYSLSKQKNIPTVIIIINIINIIVKGMYSPSGYEGKQNSKGSFNYSQVRTSSSAINNSNYPTNTYNNINFTNNLKQSTSTRQFTQAKSQQNLHILKLQSRALQQLRKLQHQKFQISTLTQQTQQLMRLCDQQKSYIKSVNIDMMKQQYQQEIKYLSQERNKLLQMINIIKQQKQLLNTQQQQKINMARMDNLLLSQKIQQALMKKQQLLRIKHQNNLIKEKYQQKVTQQQEKIDQLRHVQRKVAISLKQIQRLRKQYLQSS